MAPRMVYALLDKRTRDICGPLSPQDISDIVAFRDHAPLDVLPPLPEPDGLIHEGKLCLLGWLLEKPSLSAKRVLMQFSPDEYDDLALDDARSAVFAKCLDRFSVE